ncbi:MAG TPA: helix-turn-helix domain-containing protein [Pyrinomonadaceae bacterium]|jgi:DNA-binding response OmpR family regulator
MSKELASLIPARGGRTDAGVYDDGRLRVEHDNYYVACDGRPLRCPRVEFLLLSRLVGNAGRIVRAEDLWRYAWGNHKPYNAESLHVHIYRLRHKLAPFGIRIETMINVGYRLLSEESVPPRLPGNVEEQTPPRRSSLD